MAQKLFPVAVPVSSNTMTSTLTALVGVDRAEALMASNEYAVSRQKDSMRSTFEAVVTDGVWRCPNRAVASAWANAGGIVWTGEFTEGATYPTNEGDYCQAEGRVCHEVRQSLRPRVFP